MSPKLKKSRFVYLVLAVTALLVLLPLGSSFGADWVFERVTDDNFDDEDPRVSGDTIVWRRGNGPGATKEIYSYDGSTMKALTNNAISEVDVEIDGDNVVWGGWDGSDNEIVLYNGSTATTLTNDSFNHTDPQVSGDNIVWMGYSGDHEIFFYNGSTVTTLTDNDSADYYPQIDGDNAVWQGLRGDWEIFHYDGSTVTTLTDNSFHDVDPQISGNNVVWSGSDGSDFEIFLYDGSTVTTLTDNSYRDSDPQISGNNVVWKSLTGSDWELFLYNGSTVTTLTDNAFDDQDARISGNNIVWQGGDGNDNEILFYNGSTVTTLTDNDIEDYSPQIDGNVVTWYGYDGDEEIFMGLLDDQPPTGTVKINQDAPTSKMTGVTLNLAANDTGGSDVEWMRLKNNGDSWSAWEPYKTTKSWDLLDASALNTGRNDGTKKVWAQFKDGVDNISTAVFDTIVLDTQRPTSRMVAPFVSTRISKTTTFKVRWMAKDPSRSSGLKSVRVYYRPSDSPKWRLWKTTNKSGEANFTGRAGTTYYFKTLVVDKARNWKWSKAYKTILPFNEGASLYRRIGFNGYSKSSASQNYLSSVRYSYASDHTLVYKLHATNGIGLIVTKGPNMGRAQIYLDGKYVTTVDAYKSSKRARQLIYYKGFTKKGTHFLKVVNLGTPGRAKFEVDGVVVGR